MAQSFYISDFKKKHFGNFSNFEDLKNAQLYVINGYIVNSFDMGEYPICKDIMDIWFKFHGNEKRLFTRVEVSLMICKVSKFYK